MKYEEAKREFVETWTVVGSKWGLSPTMAQVHGLLLMSPDSMSMDEIMTGLQISRGNASMSLRALIDWGLVEKKVKLGTRTEYYSAEKDVWKMVIRILKERRKRELAPLKSYLDEAKPVDDRKAFSREYENFNKVTGELKDFISNADTLLNRMAAAEKSWFFSNLMKFILTK